MSHVETNITATRSERVKVAQALRAEGLTLQEISDRMDTPISTVHEYVWDPDLRKHYERRRRNAGTCVDCGTDTDASNGPPAKRCRTCRLAFQRSTRYWTEDKIIEAIQRWAAMYGAQPSAADWNPAQFTHPDSRQQAQERYEAGEWPALRVAQERFGSWNAAVAAAGFTPRAIGKRGLGRVPATRKAA